MAKNAVAATQMEKAEAAMLNSARYADRDSRLTQRATISVSRTTVRVPAETPNKSTDAKTNVSETVSLAVMPGTLMEKEPVRRVRPARTSHSGAMGFE